MELSREEEMQAYSDALAAILIAVGRQVSAERLVADLKRIRDGFAAAGNGPSAGLLDELAMIASEQLLGAAPEH